MKMIAAVPCFLLTLATLGCSQQHATAPEAAPAAAAAAPAASETNTFGESKEDAAGSAADARAAHYGSDQSTAPQAPADGASAPK